MTKAVYSKNSGLSPRLFLSPTSPVLTVALGCLAAIGAGLALYGGFADAWDLGFTIGLASLSLLSVIAAVATRVFAPDRRSETPLSASSLSTTPPEKSSSTNSFFETTLPTLLSTDLKRTGIGEVVYGSPLDLRSEELSFYNDCGTGFFESQRIAPSVAHYTGGYGYPGRLTPVLWRLPRTFLERFPKPIQEKLKPLQNVDVFFIINQEFLPLFHHSSKNEKRPELIDFDHSKNNLQLHRIVFPHVPVKANQQRVVEAGLFSTEGIQDGWHESDRRRIGVETWRPLQVHVHDGACSPNNAHFRVTESISSFFAGVKIDESRGAAIFNVVLEGKKSETTSILRLLKQHTVPSEFIKGLGESEELEQHPVIKKIQTFFA